MFEDPNDVLCTLLKLMHGSSGSLNHVAATFPLVEAVVRVGKAVSLSLEDADNMGKLNG